MDIKPKHIAFKCFDCGSIQIHEKKFSDGNSCKVCNGYLEVMGEALVVNKALNRNVLSVGIEVDTTKVDIAIDKLKELIKLNGNAGLAIGEHNG